MPYTMKFIVMVCAAFFARVKPVSTSAKPACMNITRKPATSVQTKLMATVLASMSPSGVLGVSRFVHDMHVSVYTVHHSSTATAYAYADSCTTCTNMQTPCHWGKRGELRGGRRSILGQVALDLPLAHAADVLLPFLPLGLHEPLVDM